MKTLLIAWTLFILLAAHGCGIFSTRNPEEPIAASDTYQPPVSPEIVLENLAASIRERNSNNYLRCLVDTVSSERRFRFIPTSDAAGRYASVFASWNLQSEQSYFQNIIAVTPADAQSSLALNGSFQVLTSDSSLYFADYILVVRHGLSGIPETYSGRLQFTLATDRNQFWSIVQWEDIEQAGKASWSDLKGRFSN